MFILNTGPAISIYCAPSRVHGYRAWQSSGQVGMRSALHHWARVYKAFNVLIMLIILQPTALLVPFWECMCRCSFVDKLYKNLPVEGVAKGMETDYHDSSPCKQIKYPCLLSLAMISAYSSLQWRCIIYKKIRGTLFWNHCRGGTDEDLTLFRENSVEEWHLVYRSF